MRARLIDHGTGETVADLVELGEGFPFPTWITVPVRVVPFAEAGLEDTLEVLGVKTKRARAKTSRAVTVTTE